MHVFHKECGPPPHTATAIPKTMGPTGVGSHIEYICRDGFLADGPLIAECLPSEEWVLPECRGKKNALLNVVPTEAYTQTELMMPSKAVNFNVVLMQMDSNPGYILRKIRY